MSTKSLAPALNSLSIANGRSLSSCLGIALFAVTAMISRGAWAEQNQQQPTSDHQQLCKDLYNIYDTNMDEHYNKKNSAKARQASYVQAERALSDFRKQGCKTKDIK